jgi:hypothetical protein
LPSDFVLGVDRQRLDFEIKWPSYLRGEWREHGWWYYYLYGLLVKLPIAYLVIGGLAIGQLVYISRKQVADMLTLLSPSVALFVFVSSHTGFNHHVRYVLPALPMIYVWLAGVWKPMSRLKGGAVVITALFLSGVVSVLSMYPHHHAYFNVIGGGAKQGHLHLLNSNLDWGQGILELARWSKGNPNNRLDGVACCSQRLIRMSDTQGIFRFGHAIEGTTSAASGRRTWPQGWKIRHFCKRTLWSRWSIQVLFETRADRGSRLHSVCV